jgi:transposase-like protein
MATLIPLMTDRSAAADWFHQGRWGEALVACPHCGASGEAVKELSRAENGIRRYSCQVCAQTQKQTFATFTDWTETLFENSHLAPEEWIQVIHHWQLGLNNEQISWATGLAYDSVARACKLLDGAIYETYHLDPQRQLSQHVEADEFYQTAGAKGRPDYVENQLRLPRKRGLSERGRGSWDKDRPPVLGLVQRRPTDDTAESCPSLPAQVFMEVLPNVQTETIRPLILARVQLGSRLDTDDYAIYNFLEAAGYEHHIVVHSEGEYARGDVHVNTMEGLWSALEPFLERFRGLSKRFLHLPVARFEFLHNHWHLDACQRATIALGCFFRACGRYLRQMVHKPRSIVATSFYP